MALLFPLEGKHPLDGFFDADSRETAGGSIGARTATPSESPSRKSLTLFQNNLKYRITRRSS
jgi:hypothetical protein